MSSGNGQTVEPPVGPAAVDPDEAQFRADTLLMHAELVELELYTIRRKWFQDPALFKLNVGASNPVEQTIRGYEPDPYNGVTIYNPTPATLSVGFQVGAGYQAPATVPPFSFATFPERFVNLSIAVLNPLDQATAITNPVTVLCLKYPPVAAAGPFTSPAPLQPLQVLSSQSAIARGQVLDNGYPRAAHSIVVSTSAGVTGGTVALEGSNDNVNFVSLVQVTTNAANSLFPANASGWPFRWVTAVIRSAITGGTVSAIVASA